MEDTVRALKLDRGSEGGDVKRLMAGLALVMALCALGRAQCNTRVADYLKGSGYTFNADKACKYWIISDALAIPRDGLQGSILIADEKDFLVIGAVVRLKANLDLSAAMLTKLLHLNHDLAYVKVGIDNAGVLFVRAEIRQKWVDAELFKASLQDVISGSNTVHQAIQ
jgi:hypothetical protein